MAFINIGQVIYPVGSFYFSMRYISPATLFGGTWSLMDKGVFPYFDGTENYGGQTIYKHSHSAGGLRACIGAVNSDTGTIGYYRTPVTSEMPKYTIGLRGSHIPDSGITGINHGTLVIGSTESQTMTIMPPYQAIYAWHRTA